MQHRKFPKHFCVQWMSHVIKTFVSTPCTLNFKLTNIWKIQVIGVNQRNKDYKWLQLNKELWWPSNCSIWKQKERSTVTKQHERVFCLSWNIIIVVISIFALPFVRTELTNVHLHVVHCLNIILPLGCVANFFPFDWLWYMYHAFKMHATEKIHTATP